MAKKIDRVCDMNIEPIGIIHSCYKEKFGIPRQAGLIRKATATLELLSPYNVEDALRGIDEFSHLWIIFGFHKSNRTKFQPMVRPPRLGGNTRLGVFASRAPFRPNPLGLSVVQLNAVKGTTLDLSGGDFLDGTPVFDIKPYIPYADSLPAAHGAFADNAPEPTNTVHFSKEAEPVFRTLPEEQQQVLLDMLGYNPRPAYLTDDPNRLFGTSLFDFEIKWKHERQVVTVTAISPSLEKSL